MKIDEAINFVENMLYLYRPTGEQHDKWCELLNLLRWYREQDLVQRKKVDVAIGKLFAYCKEKAEEMGCEIKLDAEIMKMIEIPKAEPISE